MAIVRKPLAAIITVALVWLSLAGGIVAASTTGAQQGGHWRHHAQFVSTREAGHAHHAAGHLVTTETASHSGYDGSRERDCAAACLNTIAAKLLPSSVVVKAPDTDCVMADFCAADLAIAPPVPITLAYWPAAPPDTAAAAGTGAARVLAHHSHLRL